MTMASSSESAAAAAVADGGDVATSTSSTPSSLICAIVSEEGTGLTDEDIRTALYSFLDKVAASHEKVNDIFLLPPDFTRYHSMSGKITSMIAEYYEFINNDKNKNVVDESTTTKQQQQQQHPKKKLQIMPALGTHKPMTQTEITTMFGQELATMEPNPFLIHDWRNDVVTIGHAPKEMVNKATHGMVDKPWPAQLNSKVWEKRHSLNNKDKDDNDNNNNNNNNNTSSSIVISIGQVVPHEVMGMANFNKNLFVGVGGLEAINLSHFIGAVYGMENMMGKASNPLREILNYSSEKFLQNELNLWYILTVIGPASSSKSKPNNNNNKADDDDNNNNDTTTTTDSTQSQSSSAQPPLEMKGLFIGNDIQCYEKACELSLKVNFTMLEKPPKKMVVYLDGSEFHSTWLGNKSIYRTRMAIADGGELIVLAPGIDRFGEDDTVDELIRKFGYVGTPQIMKYMEDNQSLKDNLGAVAHLIHGSTEGRFKVTYCCKKLSQEEIEGVGYTFVNYDDIVPTKYNPTKLTDGWQTDSETGEEFFYISNPALGLWAVKSRFNDDDDNNNNNNDDNEKEKEEETKKPRLA